MPCYFKLKVHFYRYMLKPSEALLNNFFAFDVEIFNRKSSSGKVFERGNRSVGQNPKIGKCVLRAAKNRTEKSWLKKGDAS